MIKEMKVKDLLPGAGAGAGLFADPTGYPKTEFETNGFELVRGAFKTNGFELVRGARKN